MTRKIFFISLFFMVLVCLHAIEVNIDEIRNIKKIEFENYKGIHTRVDTERSIRNIGTQLAWVKNINELFRFYMKYSIIHIIEDSSNDKFNADIISIDQDANVDHIDNLRLIISGYLSKKYGYNIKESDAIALFITYYNAFYRKNIGYFEENYKTSVVKNIDKNNAGLSTKYNEWPGQSKIIIPLSVNTDKNTKKMLNIDEFSDKKITDEIRKADDKKIIERKEIVKLKETDILNEKKEIEKDKKDINIQKKNIQDEKEKISKEQEKILEKEKDIKKDKEELKDIKNNEQKEKKEKEILNEEKKIADKKNDLKEKDIEIKNKEEKIVEKEKEIKNNEKEIADKERKLLEEKQQIKNDELKTVKKSEIETKKDELLQKEKELNDKEAELKRIQHDDKVYEDKFYYLKTQDFSVSGHYNNELFIIDAASMKVLLKSSIDKICGNKYLITKDGIVVITYKTNHDADHNLTLLDLNKLDVLSTGNDNIYFRSFIEENDNFLFVIIKNQDDYFLAKFNKKLEKIAVSLEKIDYGTFIVFYKNYIYVNSSKKEILVLDKNNLNKIGIVNP